MFLPSSGLKGSTSKSAKTLTSSTVQYVSILPVSVPIVLTSLQFTGVLVQPAAYTFIYRFMANHTKARPEGVLNHKVFESWFSITGQSGSYRWVPGHERM